MTQEPGGVGSVPRVEQGSDNVFRDRETTRLKEHLEWARVHAIQDYGRWSVRLRERFGIKTEVGDDDWERMRQRADGLLELREIDKDSSFEVGGNFGAGINMAAILRELDSTRAQPEVSDEDLDTYISNVNTNWTRAMERDRTDPEFTAAPPEYLYAYPVDRLLDNAYDLHCLAPERVRELDLDGKREVIEMGLNDALSGRYRDSSVNAGEMLRRCVQLGILDEEAAEKRIRDYADLLWEKAGDDEWRQGDVYWFFKKVASAGFEVRVTDADRGAISRIQGERGEELAKAFGIKQ